MYAMPATHLSRNKENSRISSNLRHENHSNQIACNESHYFDDDNMI